VSAPARIGAVTTLLLHAAALIAVLTYAPARSALLDAAPIMVDWITAPAVAPVAMPAQPRAEPPKPKRVAPRALPRPASPPVTTAATEAAQPIAPVPTPPAPIPAPAEPVAMVSAPAPVAVTPPLFNAAYLDNQPPSYPPLSRRLGEQGRVVLRVLVDANGSAGQVEIRASSGSERLDESARATVSRWKFVPAKRGDEPFAEWVLVPISFKLEG
jgi:periplasmic protein TonB